MTDNTETRRNMVDTLIKFGIDRSDAEPAVDVGMKAWELGLEKTMEHCRLVEHSPLQELLALTVCGYGAKVFARKCEKHSQEFLPQHAMATGNTEALMNIMNAMRENSNADQ